MQRIHQIELVLAIAGILIVAVFLFPTSSHVTGNVSGVNFTVYSQSLDLMIDGSGVYILTSVNDNPLELSSLTIDGELIGKGRAEVLIDNEAGQQFLIYENVKKKLEPKPYGITGVAIDNSNQSNNTKEGIWFVIQPSKSINYQFTTLESDEELITGSFRNACVETCKIDKGVFNNQNYQILFRLEPGTQIHLDKIKYTLQEKNQ